LKRDSLPHKTCFWASAQQFYAAFSEGGFTLAEEHLMEPEMPFPYDRKVGLQHEQPVLAGKAVAMRTREWTYVYRLYEPDELYDRARDPGESANLAEDPAHADTVRACRERVLRWLVETGDVIPWDSDPRRPHVYGRALPEIPPARP